MTVASVWISNYYSHPDLSRRIGNTYVFVGDDITPFSESLILGTSNAINEGGFINLDEPIFGRYVAFRRIGRA